jgi:hypothetical protein
MQVRTLKLAALLPVLALAACDTNNTTGTGSNNNNATVRFINATTTSLDIASSGTVTSGNGALGFGNSSSCMTVDATSSNLAVRQTGTSTALSGFTPSFQAGGNYTVVAYTGAGGATQFATVSNAFTPSSGQGGLRVFNAGVVGSNYDIYVTAPGAALGTTSANNIGFGAGSSFFNVNAGTSQQVRITNAGSQSVALDVGNQTFTAGQNATLIIAPPAPGSTTLRSFIVAGC